MPEPDFNKIDFEPYFLRWNSVLFAPDPSVPENQQMLANYSGDGGSIPCHQHKTCNGLVHATDKYPPRICPHCKVDTDTELTEEERRFDPSALSAVIDPAS